MKVYFALSNKVPYSDIDEACGAIGIFSSRDAALKFAGDEDSIIEREEDLSDLRKIVMDVARQVVFKKNKISFQEAKKVPIETASGVDALNAS